MSAAAAQRLKQSRSRRVPLPPELEEQIEVPEKNFGKVPHSFWSAVRHKFHTGFEKDIALLLAERSYGGRSDGHGGWWNPKWVELPAREVAAELGNVDEEGHAKIEGVEKCLKSLESDERRLIESKLVGRVKYYRLCPENFESAPDRQVRSIERKPPESAEEAHVREVPPSQPLILLAGEKSRPFVLGDYRGKFTSGFSFPITVLPSLDEAGDLDIAIHPHEGEKQAKTNRRTPVRLSAHAIDDKASRTALEQEKELRDRNMEEATSKIAAAEVALMSDFLNRWCRADLGPVSEATAKEALTALGNATREDFAKHLKARKSQVKFLSWTLVVKLAGDVGREAAARSARSGWNPVVDPQLTEADQAELDQFTKRQKERFGK